MFADWFAHITQEQIDGDARMMDFLRRLYKDVVGPEVWEHAKKRGDAIMIRGGTPEEARAAAEEYARSRGFTVTWEDEVNEPRTLQEAPPEDA